MNNQGPLRQAHTGFSLSPEAPEWQPEILLVADDERICDEHGDVLAKLTIHHHRAANAAEALGLIETEPQIAVIIIDAEDANPGCLELLTALRERLATRSWAQYLLVTAKAEAQDCINAMRLGATDILLRPTEMRQFPHAVLSLLSRSGRAHEQHHALALSRAAPGKSDCHIDGKALSRHFDNRISTLLYGPEPPLHHSADQYQSIIDVLLRLREVRQEILPSQASDEVSWTILLDVYQSMRQEHATSLSNVMISRTSASTALRRVHDMIETGLIDRSPDPDDRRRYFTHLTKKGWDAVEQYLRFAEQMLDAYRHPN